MPRRKIPKTKKTKNIRGMRIRGKPKPVNRRKKVAKPKEYSYNELVKLTEKPNRTREEERALLLGGLRDEREWDKSRESSNRMAQRQTLTPREQVEVIEPYHKVIKRKIKSGTNKLSRRMKKPTGIRRRTK